MEVSYIFGLDAGNALIAMKIVSGETGSNNNQYWNNIVILKLKILANILK